jgi:hypothetical protein
MDPNVKKLALRATAKVALSLTVAGCVGQVSLDEAAEPELDAPDPGRITDPVYAGRTAPALRPAPDEELACDAATGQGAPVDAAQVACCDDLVGELAPTGEGNWEEEWQAWQAAAADPDVQGCCGVLVAAVEQDSAARATIGWQALSACCDALEFPAGPACTPWGPPVPPALRRLVPLMEVA